MWGGGVITVERDYDHSNSYNGKHFIGAGLVHYHHGSKHGGMLVDLVLEKELRALHLEAGRDSDTGPGLSISQSSKYTLNDTHPSTKPFPLIVP